MLYFRPDYQRVRKGVGRGRSVHSAWRFLLKVIPPPCFLSLDSTLPDSGASLVKFTRGKCLWSIAGGKWSNSSSCVMGGGRDLGINPTVNMFLCNLPMRSAVRLSLTFQHLCCLQVLSVFCVLWRQFPPFYYGVLCFISHLPSSIFSIFQKLAEIFSHCLLFVRVYLHPFYFFTDILIVSGGKRHILVVNLPWLIARLRTWCSLLSSRFQSKCFS